MEFDHQEMFETLVMSESVQVKYKDESTLMKALGFLSKPFNSRFMGMTTTFGKTIYFPGREWVKADHYRAWLVLCHELVHVEDYNKEGMLFSMKYSMPQGLGSLALLSLVLQAWWPLLFLLFLAPIPAPWRTKTEMRGYAMSMAAPYWLYGGGIPLAQKEKISIYFTGPLYYFMWPFKSAVMREISRWSKKILTEEIFDEGDVYVRVHRMIKARTTRR